MLLVLLVLCSLANGLVCSYACDDPVCQPNCQAVCSNPVCQISCTDPAYCYPLRCRTECSGPFNETMCPMCETRCDPLNCFLEGNRTQYNGCGVLCEAPACGWGCSKPTNCRAPRCELQCQAPSCQYSGASGGIVASLGILLLLLI